MPGYPTYVALNAKGETLSRWSGYSKEPFLARTEELVKDPTTVQEKMTRFAAAPSEADAAVIARYYESSGKYREAVDHYRKAADLTGSAGGYEMEMFEAAFEGIYDEVYTPEEVAGFAKDYFAVETDPAELITPARMMVYAANQGQNPGLAVPFVKEAIERTDGSGDPDVEKGRKRLLPDYALLVEKDKKKALKYKRDGMPEGWMDDYGQINSFTWWCFENNVNLKEAQDLAQRGADLAPAGSEKAQVLDTLAEIQNARGNCSDAVVTMQMAVAEHPEREYYRKQLRRFQDLLAKGGK